MADSRQFQINIVTTNDPAGAKQAADGLKDVQKAGEKSAEGIFESHREVHKLLDTLGNQTIPGMGQAFGSLAHGPIGTVIAMGLAVEFVKRGIEDTNKRLDEMSANASKAFGGGDWLTDYVKAAAEAAAQTDTLAAALKKASDAGPEIKNRYEGEAKAIQEIADAIKEKLKAQEESEVIDARTAAKKSGASPEVASATEAEIRARYESRSVAAQAAAEQALQQARARELTERQRNQEPLNNAATAATTPARVIQTREERANELTGQEAALAKATSDLNTKANDDLNERIEGLKFGLENMRKDGSRASLIRTRESDIALLESETAENRADAAKERIQQLSKEVAKDKENADREKTALDQASTAATQNAARVVELQKQIADAGIAAQIKTESVSKLISGLQPYVDPKTFEKTAGVDSAAGIADFANKFLEAQARLMQHHGTANDSQTVELMNRMLQVTAQSDGRVFAVLQELIRSKTSHAQAISQLQRQIQQSPTMRGSPTGQ